MPTSSPPSRLGPRLTRQLSGVSILSGMYAYARFGSLPSLLGAFGVGGVLGMSSMRMRDNMNYGVVGAAGQSWSPPTPSHPAGVSS